MRKMPSTMTCLFAVIVCFMWPYVTSNAVCKGENAYLPCAGKDRDVTWKLPSGKPVPKISEKYRTTKNGTLIVYDVQKSDAGVYKCRIAGKELKYADVKLAMNCENVIVFAGKDVTMSCRANLPKGKMEKLCWSFYRHYLSGSITKIAQNGNALIEAKKMFSGRLTARDKSISIKKIQKSDSGTFACNALWTSTTNKGKTTYKFYLKVEDLVPTPTGHSPPGSLFIGAVTASEYEHPTRKHSKESLASKSYSTGMSFMVMSLAMVFFYGVT